MRLFDRAAKTEAPTVTTPETDALNAESSLIDSQLSLQIQNAHALIKKQLLAAVLAGDRRLLDMPKVSHYWPLVCRVMEKLRDATPSTFLEQGGHAEDSTCFGALQRCPFQRVKAATVGGYRSDL